MKIIFFIAASLAVASSLAAITRKKAIHAILFLVVSFMSIAVVFYTFGAPFIAALEVITYAGAIMVLFVFAIMLIDPGVQAARKEQLRQSRIVLAASASLSLALVGELAFTFFKNPGRHTGNAVLSAVSVGTKLYGTYLIGVELASMLLLSGLIGAYYLGRRADPSKDGKGTGNDSFSA